MMQQHDLWIFAFAFFDFGVIETFHQALNFLVPVPERGNLHIAIGLNGELMAIGIPGSNP